MNDFLPPDISPGDLLARFLKSKHWVRTSPNPAVKPDAFMPPTDLHLSVTRHLGLSEEALWEIGAEVVREIAEKQTAILLGRADFSAESIPPPLKALSAPLPRNRNHAHIVGWPPDKPSRKNLAQRIAAVAIYVPFAEI